MTLTVSGTTAQTEKVDKENKDTELEWCVHVLQQKLKLVRTGHGKYQEIEANSVDMEIWSQATAKLQEMANELNEHSNANVKKQSPQLQPWRSR